MKNFRLILISLLVLIFISTCSKKPSNDTLLKIENDFYSLEKFFNEVPKNQFLNSNKDKKKRYIKNFVKKKIYPKEAKKVIKDNPIVDWKVFNKKVELYANNYVQKVMVDSIVTEERLKQAYNDLNKKKPFEEVNFDNNQQLLKRLRGTILPKHSNEARNIYNNLINDVKEEAGVEVYDDKINEVVKKYTNYTKVTDNPSVEGFFNDVEINGILLSTSSKEYGIDWLRKRLKYDSGFKNRFLTSKRLLKGHLNQYIINKQMISRAEKTDIVNNKIFKEQINEARDQAMVRAFIKKEVENSLNIGSKEIENYYNKNKDKYIVPAKAEVREIFSKDKKLLDSLLQKIQNGDNFDTLSNKYTERNRNRDKPGYLGYISKVDYSKLGEFALKANKNSIVDSILTIGDGYSLIKVYDKKDSHPKSLQEVRSKIENRLRSNKINQKREELFTNMKNKYNVKIYWDTVNLDHKG